MNDHLEQSLNVLGGSAALTAEVFPRANGRTQGWFRRPNRQELSRERILRQVERRRERARIARELHDTLFQGFLGATLVLHDAVERMPADSPSKPSLSRALRLMHRVMDEGRVALQGLRASRLAPGGLEQALSNLRDEFAPGDAGFRVFVMGRPKTLESTIQKQIFLIAREALANAFQHSEATSIEVDVEYLPSKVRVVVRDNGRGIDPQVLRSGRESHWGLLGMRERARGIGAQLRIWSKPGVGTEVELRIAGDIAAEEHSFISKSPSLEQQAVS
jgi:signal transduction histidine kinase